MKWYILLSVVALLATGQTSSSAPKTVESLPQVMQGDWCYKFSWDATAAYQRSGCDTQGEATERIVIDSRRLDAWESTCAIKRIREINKGKVYIFEMRCTETGMEWDQGIRASLSGDDSFLYLKDEWRSKERVAD